MKCRLCHSARLGPVPFPLPPEVGDWKRCLICGSDSNSLGYDKGNYREGFSAVHRGLVGGVERAENQVRSNCDWFAHHHTLGEQTFLDVGCADGAALSVMQSFGWGIHGFDVVEPDYMGPHVTVAPHFSRWLFPRRYAAILCREVIEHVPEPHLLLLELHGACLPGGLVQVQTPRPLDRPDPNVYQQGHLFLISPTEMRSMLAAAMLDVLDSREWDTGQVYLCRARV